MTSTTGSLPQRSGSRSFQTDARARLVEIARLLLIGAVATALHAATRGRIEIGPGHQGLTWLAMLMIGRLTSPQRWAGVTTALGAAGASLLPFWRLGDPFMWASSLCAGVIVDLGMAALQSRRALWLVALVGGAAHAVKPLFRSVIQLGGWRYESLLAGVSFPTTTHFLFGAAGALIGAALVNVVLDGRESGPAEPGASLPERESHVEDHGA